MEAPNIKGGLTKRIGPLPVWGYGAAGIGGYLVYKLLFGGDSDDSDVTLVPTPTGAPQNDPSYPSADAFSALASRVEDIADLLERPTPNPTPPVNNPTQPGTTPPPAVTNPAKGLRYDLGTYILGLRALYPDVAKRFTQKQKPNETAAQRNARLQAEFRHFGKPANDLGTYVLGLRHLYPSLAKAYQGPKAKPGETPAQRQARLLAEADWFVKQGKGDITRRAGGQVFVLSRPLPAITAENMRSRNALQISPPEGYHGRASEASPLAQMFEPRDVPTTRQSLMLRPAIPRIQPGDVAKMPGPYIFGAFARARANAQKAVGRVISPPSNG